MIKKYREKPVEIEAVQWTGFNKKDIENFMGTLPKCHLENEVIEKSGFRLPVFSIIIPTLEGEVKAQIGDYIIKGIQGEFYPCKPNIFQKMYKEIT